MTTLSSQAKTQTTRQQENALAMPAEVEQIIDRALLEDLDNGTDITSQAIVPEAARGRAQLILKQAGIIAGLPVLERVFAKLDRTVTVKLLQSEGARLEAIPLCLAEIEGNARALLLGERTALNLIQRLSGIATISAEYAERARGKNIAILDTRKTTPGLRALEKYAVAIGGAVNHRRGLFDAILIKDNHISVAGCVKEAVARCRQAHPELPVEVEVTNSTELKEALAAGAEKIMLDNMSPAQVQESVAIVAGRAFIEVSGGINLTNIDSYLIAGVDAISIGALTHSVRSLDISLEIEV